MNTLGHNFRLTTFGESHGLAVGGIIDGCPANIKLDFDAIEAELARRRGGNDETTQRQEPDKVDFLSGLLNDITLGTPIAFIIKNSDARPGDYECLREYCRPGHADFTYQARYGIHDHSGGGRSSGRETVARVVAGAISKQILKNQNINIAATVDNLAPQMPEDTRGGVISCRIDGLRAGIGNPVFGRLNAALAFAAMSIPSATAFEMGIGTAASTMTGSEYVDQWLPDGHTVTNHCGGIQGGISNGMPIEFRVHFHAAPTLPRPIDCLSSDGKISTIEVKGRHDLCHIHRLPVVVEAMTALTIIDFLNT